MPKEQWQKLKADGLAPEDVEQALEGDVFIRPIGLPMGFRNSCAIWTAVATCRTLTRKWRKQGIRCLGYIDAFLCSCSSK